MATTCTELDPPFDAPVGFNKAVKTSKVEFVENSEEMDRTKLANINDFVKTHFGDEPDWDVFPMPFLPFTKVRRFTFFR